MNNKVMQKTLPCDSVKSGIQLTTKNAAYINLTTSNSYIEHNLATSWINDENHKIQKNGDTSRDIKLFLFKYAQELTENV